MALALPTRQTIFQAILDEITDRLPEANTGEGEPYWVVAQIIATAIWSVFQPVAYVAEQIFPTSADSPFLAKHGAARRVPRKGAAAASGYALLTASAPGGTQPQGTVLTDAGGSTYTSTQGAAIATAPWGATTVAGFDPAMRDRFIAANVTGMSPGDVFSMAGNIYCIKALPGGAAVIVYGYIPFSNPLGYSVTPWPGARVAVKADAAGAAGNVLYGGTLTVGSPATAVNATAYVLELSGGSDVESEAAWAQRIEDTQSEYPAGGNRSQLRGWALGLSTKEERDANAQKLYALGVDRAFVYPLYRGLGSVNICVQGIKGARHLSSARIAAIQEYIQPAIPTDANPGQVGMGADVLVVDFIDQVQNIDIGIIGDAGYGPDWIPGINLVTNVGCTQTRINTVASPINIIQPGNRVALTLPSGKLIVARTTSVDATGMNVSPAMPEAPAAGATLYPGSSLIEPVRDAIIEMFDLFGPGDTGPRPSRYPAVSNDYPCNLSRAAIARAVMSVQGVSNVFIAVPNSDVRAIAQNQIILGNLIISHGT